MIKPRRKRHRSIFAQQPLEIGGFAYLLGQYNCKTYLEIGSRYGGSLLQTCALMNKVVSVDAAQGQGAQANSDVILLKNLARIAEQGVETHFIKGFSYDPDVLEQVKQHGPFDAIFIDAAHDYKSVKHDWETYGPLATKFVGFHDIYGTTRGNHILEVHQLWDELKQSHVTLELIDKNEKMGIGVVFK